MYYFDSDFLRQYLEQNIAVKVFVDGEYYDIADEADLADVEFGIGYNNYGKPHTFDYRSISQIKAGSNILTKDQLANKVDGTEEEPASGEEGGGEEMPDMGGGEEDSNGGMPDLKGDGDVPPEEEEPEPPREGYTARELFGMMISEGKENQNTIESGFVKGDLVENIDKLCEFHGSRGSVTNVDMPDNDGGIPTVEYRVFNYGYNFKPGQKVVKPATSLEKVDNG